MKKRTVEVSIRHLGKKGCGVGDLLLDDGTVRRVDVPFTLPGDVVLAELIRKRSRNYESSLAKIVQPSQDRILPKCIHFGKCGGCRWQQIPYAEQLHYKERSVRTLLQPLSTPLTNWHPILASDPYWEFRNKMEFTFSSNALGEKFLGLIIYGSKGKVLNLQICHLVNPWFIQTLQEIKKWWETSRLQAYFPPKDRGSLQTLTLREGMRTKDRMVVLTVSGNPQDALKKEELEKFVKTVQASNSLENVSIFLRVRQTIKGKPVQFYEMHLAGPEFIQERLTIDGKTLEFQISPQAFFQPNTSQAEKLYQAAIHLAKIPKNGVVLDLFCGTGTLGICAAEKSSKVIGIELSFESVLDARANLKKNGLNNVEIIQGDVGTILETRGEQLKADVVFVDPPRSGLDKSAISHLVTLKPKRIIYISCNPESQAENIKELLPYGYVLTDVQPVDQFPHTYHTENIIVLEKQP